MLSGQGSNLQPPDPKSGVLPIELPEIELPALTGHDRTVLHGHDHTTGPGSMKKLCFSWVMGSQGTTEPFSSTAAW